MSTKHCVNCPGRTDHDTADCPVMHYATLDPQQRLDVARGEQPQASAAQSAPDGMTAERAAYFMRRFKHEEKLLGPNEQAAIEYVLAMLAAQSAPAGEREAFKQALHSQTAFKLTADRIEAAEWGAAWQRTQSAGVPECVQAWYDAKLAHVEAVDAYNARLAFVEQHMPFGASVDPEYQLMEAANRKVRELVYPMFLGLKELLAAAPAQPAAHDQGEVQRRERWAAVCGDWRDTTLAIHGERTGYIACGISESAAHAIVKAHNEGLPPIAAASTGQEVKP